MSRALIPGLPGALQGCTNPEAGKPLIKISLLPLVTPALRPSLLPVVIPWENSHLPLGDHFLPGALSILLTILLQVIQVGFALSNGHRDPYVRIRDEVTGVVPGASESREPSGAPQGSLSSNVVLGYGGGKWDFHHQLGLCLGPGEQAGPTEETAKSPLGVLAEHLDPR